jgi:hypothetical protein
MTSTDAAAQLQRFEEQFLPFPPCVAAKDAIESNLQLFRESGLARHMLVLGESGTGKSSLCRWLAGQHPRRRLMERDVIEVLIVTIPPAATVAGIVDAVLRALGDPWRGVGTITAKTERIVTLCRGCGVELLLVDEAQHLQDRGAAKTHYLVGDWFKHLIDEIGVPTVLLGLPRLEELLQVNDQLRRRFSRRIRLALGQSDTESIETECLQLFLSLASLIEVSVVSEPFEASDMGLRLYYACDGRVAYIKKLLFASLRLSLDEDYGPIDASLLARAFTEEVWPGGIGMLNPFDPLFERRRLDRGGEPFESAGRRPRRTSV